MEKDWYHDWSDKWPILDYNIYIYIRILYIYVYYIYIRILYIRDDWYYDWYILQWPGKCCWSTSSRLIHFNLNTGMSRVWKITCILFHHSLDACCSPPLLKKCSQTIRSAKLRDTQLRPCLGPWQIAGEPASPTNGGTTSSWDFTIQVGFKINKHAGTPCHTSSYSSACLFSWQILPPKLRPTVCLGRKMNKRPQKCPMHTSRVQKMAHISWESKGK